MVSQALLGGACEARGREDGIAHDTTVVVHRRPFVRWASRPPTPALITEVEPSRSEGRTAVVDRYMPTDVVTAGRSKLQVRHCCEGLTSSRCTWSSRHSTPATPPQVPEHANLAFVPKHVAKPARHELHAVMCIEQRRRTPDLDVARPDRSPQRGAMVLDPEHLARARTRESLSFPNL